jgi:O-antigen/teichoic acid export membrane protein
LQRTEPATSRLGVRAAPTKDTFLKHNAIFLFGALAIGGLNYLYYPIMGHMLGTGAFGEVQALFSLFAQITIFLNVLSLLTVNIVVNYNDNARRNRVILELEKLSIGVSAVLLVVTVLAGTVLQHFFNFASPVPFLMLSLAVLISTPLTFRTGFLRGQKRFGLVVLAGVLSSLFDIIFSVVLVLAGQGTSGAILGLALAQIVACGFAIYAARKYGFTESLRKNFWRLPDLKLILPELKYAGLVFVGSLAITGLYSIDTIVVKHYFDAETAGLYAGIATIARIIFFLTASIAQVLLPSVKLNHDAAQNQRVLLKSLVMLVTIGGIGLIGFSVLSEFTIKVLMGSAYLPYANLLPRLSLVVFIISLLNLFILYHVALRRYAIAAIVAIGLALTFGLLLFHHESLRAVVDSLLYGSLGLATCLGVWILSKTKHLSLKESV